MGKGKLIQNGVHLQDHEYKTVKLFLEMGYERMFKKSKRIKRMKIIKKNREILDFPG